MKQIIFMRHADAARSSNFNDFNLPLSFMGEKQSERAGEFLSSFEIDKVLVSPAIRTVETLSIILQQCDIDNIDSVRALYDSSSEEITKIIAKQSDDINKLMILGHAQTIHQLVLDMSCSESPEYSRVETGIISTAEIIVVEIQDLTSWRDIESNLGCGAITHIFNPNLDE